MLSHQSQLRVRLTVSGHVQGVGFRYFCYEQAERLGLSGYARNTAAGAVEIEIQGDDEAVELFVQSVSHGPRRARVEHVERKERAITPADTFEIK